MNLSLPPEVQGEPYVLDWAGSFTRKYFKDPPGEMAVEIIQDFYRIKQLRKMYQTNAISK